MPTGYPSTISHRLPQAADPVPRHVRQLLIALNDTGDAVQCVWRAARAKEWWNEMDTSVTNWTADRTPFPSAGQRTRQLSATFRSSHQPTHPVPRGCFVRTLTCGPFGAPRVLYTNPCTWPAWYPTGALCKPPRVARSVSCGCFMQTPTCGPLGTPWVLCVDPHALPTRYYTGTLSGPAAHCPPGIPRVLCTHALPTRYPTIIFCRPT